MKLIEIKKGPLKNHSVSPYNFISLPQTTISRYKNIGELPVHSSFKDKEGNKLLKGSIAYTITARNPIIVSEGRDESGNCKFFRNTKGKYAIPGNTIRGVIRTNSQILSYSNVSDEIEDSRFLYRDIAGGNAASKQYAKVLGIGGVPPIARNLNVGYMRKIGKEYIIQPSIDIKMERPYFRIDEIKLRKIENKIKGIKYMYDRNLVKEENQIKQLNKGRKRSAKNRLVNKHIDGRFKPYYVEISFNYDGKNGITEIGNTGEFKNKGYLLTANHIYGKLAHYIIPEEDMNQRQIKMPDKTIESYIDDMIVTKKAKNQGGKIIVDFQYEFYDLPKESQVKPVFYIKLGEDIHFGFTPNLRIMYGKSILEGLPEHYDTRDGISYTDAIFGFTNMGKNNTSYKSRVSFEDVVIDGHGVIDSDSIVDVILAEPKATSYNLYVEQELDAGKNDLDIYEDDFQIRGIKQYWLKKYVEKPNVKRGKMVTKIYPLREGTKFKGRIHFENLKEDELGLLLWSLKLEENCYQNIGMAKSHGFGRVKIGDIDLVLEDLDKKYNNFSFDYTQKENEDKFINIYKIGFSEKYLNGSNIQKEKPIRELIEIKSKLVEEKDANFYRYMEIAGGYDQRGKGPNEFIGKKVLPDILNYDNAIRGKLDNKYKKNHNINHNNSKRLKSQGQSNKDTKNKTNNSFGNKLDLSDWNK